MPVHDWTRVDAETFHDFHNGWIIHLKEALNGGLLPKGYYAMSEQYGGAVITDVMTLQAPLPSTLPAEGGIAVADAPPHVRRKLSLSAAARAMRRTVTIRHVSGHKVVALLEIVSPANKDRSSHVEDFVAKTITALSQGVHVVLVDLLPPGKHDPQGMHGEVWDRLDDEHYELPPGEPLTLASYVAEGLPQAYLEHLAVGRTLVEMPLFLDPDRYINLPLETTYQAARRGMPEFWRDVLDGKQAEAK
jgi:hypothetical protein